MSLFGDLNEVKILGNITGDPELRFTANGTAVANFSLATNRSYKQGDDWKDETEFHNVVVWANLAQQLTQRAKKGTRVLVIGRLQTRSWDGQDGRKNYKTEIIADDVMLLDRYEKGKSDDLPAPKVTEGSATGSSASAGGNDAGASASTSSSASPQNSGGSSKNDGIDPDDLPF